MIILHSSIQTRQSIWTIYFQNSVADTDVLFQQQKEKY